MTALPQALSPRNALRQAAGLSLKPDHFEHILEARPAVGFFEVHAENYFGKGGLPHLFLQQIAALYPLSVHGVGLSLGHAGDLNQDHLDRLAALVDRYQPAQVSEHVAWCGTQSAFLNDLLPLPYTEQALQHLVAHVDQVQTRLGRTIAIENPSTYLRFAQADYDEAAFLVEACKRSGASLLLDVNNVYVSARNHGFDASHWLAQIPADLIAEIHLAGHTVKDVDGIELRIDDHGSEVCDEVWFEFADLIARVGPKPTLIEWDTDVPSFDVLCSEAKRANTILFDQMIMGKRHG